MTAFWIAQAPVTLAMVVPVLMLPGLDFAAVLRSVMTGGQRAGIVAAAGSMVGASLHVFGAAFGVGLLAAALPGVETVLRFLGAAILWLFAFRILRAAMLPAESAAPQTAPASRRGAFAEGMVAAALNPKTPVFFAAVFSAGGIGMATVGDRVALAAVICGLHFLWFALVAHLGSRLQARPVGATAVRVVSVALACLLFGAGVAALAV
ncbi:LysE family translocator [Roseicyclus persicicus]|uniref:LysE family transporter n=1 Tax=Roseicyclus persicicus TaxID=2650661 RepID=A0A7X6GZJ6_9RHOB|nr:LysE family transporter [Roseibacterium persicicum]NKX44629.1 LysE family transporter [Roseibacterium persicicum]